MAANLFDVNFSAVALTAVTAKTVVGVKAASNIALRLLAWAVAFDGANSGNTPALVELCRCTFATNGPGTNSTSATAQKRDPGRAETIQATGAYNWTTEPTVITVLQTKYVGQFNGSIHLATLPPILVAGGQGIVIRVTSPNNVNCSGLLSLEE